MTELYTHEEAAAQLRMHPATLHRLRQRGLISFRKAGRWVRYTSEDLTAYLESVKKEADGQKSNGKRKG
jgi:excisionase family DNA binding protein